MKHCSLQTCFFLLLYLQEEVIDDSAGKFCVVLSGDLHVGFVHFPCLFHLLKPFVHFLQGLKEAYDYNKVLKALKKGELEASCTRS